MTPTLHAIDVSGIDPMAPWFHYTMVAVLVRIAAVSGTDIGKRLGSVWGAFGNLNNEFEAEIACII